MKREIVHEMIKNIAKEDRLNLRKGKKEKILTSQGLLIVSDIKKDNQYIKK